MFKKTNFILLISFIQLHLHVVLPIWGCDKALLKHEVLECYGKISRGISIEKKQIVDGLNFLSNEKEYIDFKYANFPKAIASFSTISVKGNENYYSFAKTCFEIYENGNERERVAISMLFKKVSDDYLSQYLYKEQLSQSNTIRNNFYKTKKYDYPSLIYIMKLVSVIDCFPPDIKFFIDSILISVIEREHPNLKGELLRWLLINGDPLQTEKLDKISEKAFYLITGIKKETLEKMVDILQEVFDCKESRSEKHHILSAENILLMAIEYFAGYGTYEALDKFYGVGKTTAYRNIKLVQNIFVKDLGLNLPLIFDKKKNIADNLIINSIENAKKKNSITG
ncbi:hypothetical protein H0X06_06285 [Candidatus Dependentiae bacterium]|nr:hypothetical protein [Candidatus Dependentiae bacterium]